MEKEWANALKETPPKKVTVKINPVYEGNSKRPIEFNVKYKIGDNEAVIKSIKN